MSYESDKVLTQMIADKKKFEWDGKTPFRYEVTPEKDGVGAYIDACRPGCECEKCVDWRSKMVGHALDGTHPYGEFFLAS